MVIDCARSMLEDLLDRLTAFCVVDDHTRWRQMIRSTLMNSRRWHVVGEAADALEAIRSARMRSDRTSFSSTLNLERSTESTAARRILAADSGSKILFVSAHRSWDIAGAALSTGARGYLLKSDAGQRTVAGDGDGRSGVGASSARVCWGTPSTHSTDAEPGTTGRDPMRLRSTQTHTFDAGWSRTVCRDRPQRPGKSVIVAITEERRAGARREIAGGGHRHRPRHPRGEIPPVGRGSICFRRS